MKQISMAELLPFIENAGEELEKIRTIGDIIKFVENNK